MPMPASWRCAQRSQRWLVEQGPRPPESTTRRTPKNPPLSREPALHLGRRDLLPALVAPDVAHQAPTVAAAVRIEDEDGQPGQPGLREAGPGRPRRRDPPAWGWERGPSSAAPAPAGSDRKAMAAEAPSPAAAPIGRETPAGEDASVPRASHSVGGNRRRRPALSRSGAKRRSKGTPQGRGSRIADGGCHAIRHTAAPQPAESLSKLRREAGTLPTPREREVP